MAACVGLLTLTNGKLYRVSNVSNPKVECNLFHTLSFSGWDNSQILVLRFLGCNWRVTHLIRYFFNIKLLTQVVILSFVSTQLLANHLQRKQFGNCNSVPYQYPLNVNIIPTKINQSNIFKMQYTRFCKSYAIPASTKDINMHAYLICHISISILPTSLRGWIWCPPNSLHNISWTKPLALQHDTVKCFMAMQILSHYINRDSWHLHTKCTGWSSINRSKTLLKSIWGGQLLNHNITTRVGQFNLQLCEISSLLIIACSIALWFASHGLVLRGYWFHSVRQPVCLSDRHDT